jgi:hypothetical protein
VGAICRAAAAEGAAAHYTAAAAVTLECVGAVCGCPSSIWAFLVHAGHVLCAALYSLQSPWTQHPLF